MKEVLLAGLLRWQLQDVKMLLQQLYGWATHLLMEPMIKAARTIRCHWQSNLMWEQKNHLQDIL